MQAQALVAELTQAACDGLIRYVRAMPKERQAWEPEAGCRSARNFLRECATVNDRFARFLRGEPSEPVTMELLNGLWSSEPSEDTEQLISKLEETTLSLCESIRSLSDSQLEQSVELSPGTPFPTKMLMWMGLRNLWYHMGQVAYIQSLYGDKEMH